VCDGMESGPQRPVAAHRRIAAKTSGPGCPLPLTTALVNAYVTSWYSVFQNYTPQQFYTGGYTTASETVTKDMGTGICRAALPS